MSATAHRLLARLPGRSVLSRAALAGLFACTLIHVVGAVPAAAQTGVIGLLEMPEVFGAGGPCAPFEPSVVPIHARPGSREAVGEIFVSRPASGVTSDGMACTAGPVVTVRVGAREGFLPVDEHAYEEVSAIVVERAPGWYRIRTGLQPDSGWVRASPRMRFRSLAALLTEGLTHLEPEWDGRVWDRPFGTARVVAPPPPGDAGEPPPTDAPAVSVREVVLRRGVWWARVETIPDVCNGDRLPPTSARVQGWIRVFGPDGRRQVWFSPRGC